MSEIRTSSFTSPYSANACCAQPEALVVIEVVPLCRLGPLGVTALEVPAAACPAFSADSENSGVGLPARCATVMPCAQALALVEGVGHVVF